jgi:PglZ domain
VILDWLIGEFRDLFAHDPEAQVLLWFDAKAEFRGLLPQVEQAASDAGLVLLALDPQEGRGPLWMKWAVEAGRAADKKVVLWLPYSRDALVGGSADGLRLEVLLEYQYRGLEWRIDGKPPTLFTFLKKRGVALPAKQSEQVPLWKGGGGSPLARYVKKHAGRDQTFWQSRMLSLAIVQEGIVGSVEDRLLRFLADPDGELAVMRAEDIIVDFASQLGSEMADAQGIEEDPKAWSEAFVTGLVLLEIFEITGEPDDFPFLSRLPSVERRERQLEFLRRWMRDAEYLPKYREWALAVEPSIDLVTWARDRDGWPQSLRALVRDRWAAFLAGLQDAGPDEAGQLWYLQEHKIALVEESKGFWASGKADVPGWELAADLADLADASIQACNEAVSRHDPKSLVDSYAGHWHKIDIAHWRLLAAANRLDDMEIVARIGDRFYFKYLQCTGQAFYDSFRDGGVWPPLGCPSARDVVAALYSPPSAGEKKAVLIVDALRYGLGTRLADELDNAEVDPVIADLPSETWVGMSALVPGYDAELQVEGGHKLVSSAAAGDLCYPQYRKKLIAVAGAGTLPAGADGKPRDQVSDVLDFTEQPPGLPPFLVLFDREIDTSGHGMGGKVIHHFDLALKSTRRAIRRLQSWGYSEIHVVTDHGFVLLNSSDAVQKMEVDKDAFVDSGSRWGILAKGASVPTAVVPFALDPQWSVAVPPGIRSFTKPGGEFFHGGATMQEVVIPHILIKTASEQVLRMKVQALLPLLEVVTMTVKVELRPVRPDAKSLLDTVQGTSVRVFLGELDAPRSSEKIVPFDADAAEPLSVTLFLNREPAIPQGSEIPLQVLDVDTGESYATGLFVRAARDLG